MFSKLVPPALRKGRHPGRRWHVGGGVLLALVAGALVARSRSRQAPAAPMATPSRAGVVDITAAERADDEVAEGLQTPFPVA